VKKPFNSDTYGGPVREPQCNKK